MIFLAQGQIDGAVYRGHHRQNDATMAFVGRQMVFKQKGGTACAGHHIQNAFHPVAGVADLREKPAIQAASGKSGQGEPIWRGGSSPYADLL